MSNFYNQGGGGGFQQQQQQQQPGGSSGGSGFYNSAGGGSGTGHYGQPQYGGQATHQQQQQQYSGQPSFASNNYSQWQQPTTATASSAAGGGSNQQQQTQQQQQQQTQQAPPFWNPGAATTGGVNSGANLSSTAANLVGGVMAKAATGGLNNEAIMNSLLQGGREAWVSGGARMIPGLESGMQMLRTYFAVDNRYVKRKMQKVLFPFMSKQWKRLQTEGPDEINYALPFQDENAPDLYLPLMSLITYCLLCALLYGTAGQFNPEVIADVTTKCFLTQIFEVLVVKSGFYMMNAPIAFLDLFSYTGYKYLGLTINMLFGLMMGHLGYGTTGFYVTFLFTASGAAYFMLKTMAHNIPTETAAEGPKREVMVLGFAAMQAASMYFVSQTKYL